MKSSLAPAMLAIALTSAAAPAQAQATPCASSLVETVELLMPPLQRDVSIRDLTCNGITQIYFILTQSEDTSPFVPAAHERQRILAVFRREGLID